MDNKIDIVKEQLKNNIQQLIEENQLVEASALIEKYKLAEKDDVEIYSMEAVILIMKGELEAAESLLKKGLNIDNSNFDLFYNLGYLYEIQSRKIEAISSYKIAKLVSNNDLNRGISEENLERINNQKKCKYNVLLCGNIKLCIEFEKDFKEWNIIGYFNADNEIINNEKLIQMNQINNYDFDFIMILDECNENRILYELKECGINENVYLKSSFYNTVIEGFDFRIRELLCSNNIEMIITGLSYAEVGIAAEHLNKKAVNFSFSSQDLFYDYNIASYLLNYSNVRNSIKYFIIGLSYYSFDFDITKSIAKYRIHRYIDYIPNFHNNNDKIGINISKLFYEKSRKMKDYHDMNERKNRTKIKVGDEEQEYIAKINSTMNHNLTREENVDILNKYLQLLISNNIKPIIVICPTSKYYRKYFENCYQKNKFYKLLDSSKKNFDFQVIDHFDSNLFEDEDFWDYGHLNAKGAEKFTKILNEEIVW